jgi:peptidoglycan/xylan/chitin deacetylase (PgdA/CDA1 family)
MLTVSNYHYIRDNFDSKFPSIFGLSPTAFKEQLLVMKNIGEFVSVNELILNVEAILKSKQNFFLITFDDGLKEQYHYALPILEELKVPAVFFANSINYIERKVSNVHKIHLLRSNVASQELLEIINESYPINFSIEDKIVAKGLYIYDDEESATIKYILNFKLNFVLQEEIIETLFSNYFDESYELDKLYMSVNEILDLSKKGFLGSHTHTHNPLGRLDKEKIKFELVHSKNYFECLTNSPVEVVAYPYGTPDACTPEVASIAVEAGYKLGFTTTRGINIATNNHLLLNRFDCNDMPGGKNFISYDY